MKRSTDDTIVVSKGTVLGTLSNHIGLSHLILLAIDDTWGSDQQREFLLERYIENDKFEALSDFLEHSVIFLLIYYCACTNRLTVHASSSCFKQACRKTL